MLTVRKTIVLAMVTFTSLLLSGCQSKQLVECNKQVSFLEFRITEYKQRVDVLENDVQLRGKEIDSLRASLSTAQARVAELEKENADLQNKVAQKLEGTKSMLEGVEELRRLQKEAAEKLRQQEAEKPAESAPTAPAQP